MRKIFYHQRCFATSLLSIRVNFWLNNRVSSAFAKISNPIEMQSSGVFQLQQSIPNFSCDVDQPMPAVTVAYGQVCFSVVYAGGVCALVTPILNSS